MANLPELPENFSRLECIQHSSDFAEATEVQAFPMTLLLDQLAEKPDSILIKTSYVGINASDPNFARGVYDPSIKPPYPCGFEAVGTVSRIGSSVKSVRVGEVVCCMLLGGAFSEYLILPESLALPIPGLLQPSPEYLGIMVNGLTAWLALHKAAEISPTDTVFITGAMGATGQIAVQVAKLHGCTVVGTCGSDSKVVQLQKLGADRCINYRKEDTNRVLASEYPKGVNVVFEGIGGPMLKTAVANLAPRGRLLIIGAVSYYADQGPLHQSWKDSLSTYQLLSKSAAAIGFFLLHYSISEKAEALAWLFKNYSQKKLLVNVDPTKFEGLNQIKLAVNHLLQGKNIGKVVVNLHNQTSKL